MPKPPPLLEIRTAPHLRQAPSVAQIMRNVVYALLPVCVYAVYLFGISALALIVTTLLTCLFSERFFCRLAGKASTLGDYSAAITGLLSWAPGWSPREVHIRHAFSRRSRREA